jgi:hypothetical protein
MKTKKEWPQMNGMNADKKRNTERTCGGGRGSEEALYGTNLKMGSFFQVNLQDF